MRYVYVLFACICLCDYLWRKIPNKLLIAILLLGEWTAYATGGLEGVLSYQGVLLFAGCAFYLFFQVGALGAGDVKLIAVTCGLLPLTRIPLYLLVGFLLAGGVGVVKILRGGNGKTNVCLAGPMFASFLLVSVVL